MSETPEETETISFSVKTATQSTLAMREIKKSALISEVKSELATRMNDGSTADLIRLIYKGHVLKDDKTVKECSIGEGHAVHLVKSAPKKTNAATAGGSGGVNRKGRQWQQFTSAECTTPTTADVDGRRERGSETTASARFYDIARRTTTRRWF